MTRCDLGLSNPFDLQGVPLALPLGGMERLETLLRDAFPDASDLRVVDRTGTGDHFHVLVEDARFDGLSLVEQHKLIYAALDTPLQDGTIHELRITTKGHQ
jgi:stress-induced morphogen